MQVLAMHVAIVMFYTIRVFVPYAYGTHHTRMVCTIRVWYDFAYHTRMVCFCHTMRVWYDFAIPYAYWVANA